MRYKIFSRLALAVLGAASVTAWGCDAAGPTTHVGKVLSVNTGKNTFTILDAQTISPVSFQADEVILKKVAAGDGTAIVSFIDDGVDLIATEVEIR